MVFMLINTASSITSTIIWNQPAPILQGTPLSNTQLNAVAIDPTGKQIDGTYGYYPLLGTICGLLRTCDTYKH